MGNDDNVGEAREFVTIFRAAALQAGAVARRLQGEVRSRSKAGPGTPEAEAVSAADLAAQDVLLLRLAEVFSHAAIDAEEETESAALFAAEDPDRPLIVVDPIDGSLNYLRGSRDYAVMGSLLQGGRYAASVIHYPAWSATYWAQRGGGCFRASAAGRVERVSVRPSPSLVLVPPRTPRTLCERLAALGFEVEISRCSAVDAAAPAVGRGTGALNAKSPDRRRAIGFLLTTEAGGCVLFEGGTWDGEDPEGAPLARGPHAVAHSLTLAHQLLSAVPLSAAGGRST